MYLGEGGTEGPAAVTAVAADEAGDVIASSSSGIVYHIKVGWVHMHGLMCTIYMCICIAGRAGWKTSPHATRLTPSLGSDDITKQLHAAVDALQISVLLAAARWRAGGGKHTPCG